RPIASSGAVVHLVDGPSPEASNSFVEPDCVGVRTQPLALEGVGTAFELTFPAHSFTCVELPLQRDAARFGSARSSQGRPPRRPQPKLEQGCPRRWPPAGAPPA